MLEETRGPPPTSSVMARVHVTVDTRIPLYASVGHPSMWHITSEDDVEALGHRYCGWRSANVKITLVFQRNNERERRRDYSTPQCYEGILFSVAISVLHLMDWVVPADSLLMAPN